MPKIKVAASPSLLDEINSFPISLTVDELQAAIVDVFLHYIRTIGWMTDDKTAWGIAGLPVPKSASLFDPDDGAGAFGLTHEHIRHTQFARAMEHLYEFGFLGRLNENADPMVYESIYMWVADLVGDAATGYVAREWDTYGATICESAKQCLWVAELANARNMLEEGEPFFYGVCDASKDNPVDEGSLSVHQMALLAGMEEMSIRAAANPKRANPLKTHTEDGGTRIALDVAKTWLHSKGRYVPITRYWSDGEVDLVKRGFKSESALIQALDARCEMVAVRNGTQMLIDRLAALGMTVTTEHGRNYWGIEDRHLRDEHLMRDLAELLELPSDLLVLRARETLAIQQLAQIERQLREAANVSIKTKD